MKKYTDVAIHRSTTRAKLPPRHDPYWRSLGAGSIGYRKSTTETWIARWRDGKYYFKKLGSVHDLTYEQAKKAAEAWFKQCRAGTVRAGTVAEACKAYIANLKVEKGPKSAQYAEWTLSNVGDLGNTPLDKLTPIAVTQWRDSLVTPTRQQNSANRILRSFRAAMSFAYRQGMVSTDHAWRVVQAFKVQDGQRTVYLTPPQRAKLIGHCSPELADLLTGLYLTAARPTELTAATVADLADNTLRLTTNKGYTRSRTVHLVPAAVTLFKRMARGKLPGAALFTQAGGAAWARHQYAAALRTAVQAAKLPAGTVAYSMRHTAISDWLQAGVGIADVAKQAGTSIAMIDKNYHKFIRSSFDDKLAGIKF